MIVARRALPRNDNFSAIVLSATRLPVLLGRACRKYESLLSTFVAIA